MKAFLRMRGGFAFGSGITRGWYFISCNSRQMPRKAVFVAGVASRWLKKTQWKQQIWLCYKKWLIFFSLKLQRDNQQNVWPCSSFRLIQQSEVVHLPLFQRNIRCREGGRTSSAVKGILRQRLTALRLARLRRSRPRFARHLTAPRPLHAPLPCGGGRPQSSLTLAPPAVKGVYFSWLCYRKWLMLFP